MPVKRGRKKESASDATGPLGGRPRAARYTISKLDQLKALSDPLRVRMLEAFCHGEKTTKQVAGEIGEKTTKLYHHVDALRRAGLIRLARTRRNRGTLEKYFIAVARSYSADSRLFDVVGKAPAQGGSAMEKMVSTVFENTSAELRRVVRGVDARKGIEEEGIVTYCEMHASAREVRRVSDQLKKILTSVQKAGDATDAGKASSQTRRFRLTIAFFPLDLDERKGRQGS